MKLYNYILKTFTNIIDKFREMFQLTKQKLFFNLTDFCLIFKIYAYFVHI
jgi:hypothetical protein